MSPFGSTLGIAPGQGFAVSQRDESIPIIQDHFLLETADDILLEDGGFFLLDSN